MLAHNYTDDIYDNDVLVRFSADYLVISPSLIVEPSQIERIAETIKVAIKSVS